jgi:heme exporter protein A
MNDSFEHASSGKKNGARPPDRATQPSLQTPACKIVAMKLRGHGLACVRGGRRVFSAVSFAVAAGQALVVTGPNGAGKSSLLRLIAGLIRPAAGSVALEGGDPELTVGEQAHYVGHLDPLKPALTVTENLAFWARFLNGARAVDEEGLIAHGLAAANLVDLAQMPAGYLSAGQKRRLSLARLLAAPRPVWLLDEPTTALDAASLERLHRVMQAHLAGGGLMIAATHGPLGFAEPLELQLGDLWHHGSDCCPSLDLMDAAP